MAKGSIMIQIAVEQILSPAVNYAPEIWAVAFESLDGDRTTVRDLATLIKKSGANNDLIDLTRSNVPVRNAAIGPVQANGASR